MADPPAGSGSFATVRVLYDSVERGELAHDDLSDCGSPSPVCRITHVDTAASGKWAPAGRPVHRSAGVDIRYGYATKLREKVEPVTTELIARARSGDGEAFRELTEPYRRELLVHCYRMLGSFHDAEDVLQDTLLAAWQGFGASLRTWLYRIATNRCLNARRSASRRAAKEWNMSKVEPPEPTRLGEVVWLEPFPDALLTGAIGLEACYERSESICLAFVTALQTLPPRQLAVLVLRDVLGFHANEVAGMLDSTVESVNSALKRARAGLRSRRESPTRRARPGSRSRLILRAHACGEVRPSLRVRAYESGDLGGLVALLTDDIFVSMPPIPLEYQGRAVVARLFASIFSSGRRVDLVPTRANGQPAFGAYLRATTGIRHGSGLFVLTLTGDRICAFTRFDSSMLASFGLPRSLPSR
ncbi:sigma-70 family RNA polymerase sigma factor [Rhodococcus sp. WS4]|nr:sigma-70 family RNA polymerase sigma factor [Rhodococcus sp. WS4]